MLANCEGSPSASTKVSKESSQTPRSAKYLGVRVSKPEYQFWDVTEDIQQRAEYHEDYEGEKE